MKITKIAALALIAMLLVFAVSCDDAKNSEKTITITIHKTDGTVLSTINDVPLSITTYEQRKKNTQD